MLQVTDLIVLLLLASFTYTSMTMRGHQAGRWRGGHTRQASSMRRYAMSMDREACIPGEAPSITHAAPVETQRKQRAVLEEAAGER